MYYFLVLSFVILLILFIHTATINPDKLFSWYLRVQSIDNVAFVKSFIPNQKYLGYGTALLVILLSASAFAPNSLSLLSKSLLSFMSDYKPLMLNRRWNSGLAHQSRLSVEARIAQKNGGEIGGLTNEGNTCFMNSVLQSLASSRSLLKFFNDNVYEDTEVYSNGEVTKVRTGLFKSQMKFTASLKTLLDDLNGKYGSRGKEFSTKSLMKKMPDGPKQNFFMGYNQEDAQEFYQLVMRIVEKEYKKSFSNKSPSPEPETKTEKSKFVPASEVSELITGCEKLGILGPVFIPAHQIDPNIPDTKNLFAPFELVTPVDGISAERIGCITCGETGGIRYSVNSGLSLNLPYDRSYGTHYELLLLLDEWKKPEMIDDVNCNRCGLIQTKEFLLENINVATNQTLIANFEKRCEEIDVELEKDYISDEVFDKLTTKQMVRKTTKSKQILLSRPPPLLCIHINRSVMDPNTFMILKNSKSVSFPAVLDLNNYVADPKSINMDARLPFSQRDQFRSTFRESNEDDHLSTSELEALDEKHSLNSKDSDESHDKTVETISFPVNDDLKYQLKAVISHMGTHNYGHYICYRRLRGTWWKANDEAIYATTEAEVLSSPGTFMLFYELKDGSEEEPIPIGKEDLEEKEETEGSNGTASNGSSLLSLDDNGEDHKDEDGPKYTVSSLEMPSDDSGDEHRELFRNAEFRLGEERAYHV